MDTLHNGTENDEDMILITQDIIFPRIQRKQIIRKSHI